MTTSTLDGVLLVDKAAGMTSHASVNVMIALEDTFDVEFLDSMLKRSVFQSVASIAGGNSAKHRRPSTRRSTIPTSI